MTTSSSSSGPVGIFLLSWALLAAAGFFIGCFVALERGDSFALWATRGLLIGAVLPAGFVALFGLQAAYRILRNEAIWRMEQATHRDLNRDGYTGQPQVEKVFLPTAPVRPETYRLAGAERSYTPTDLRFLIHHVCTVHGWSGRTMRGMRLPSGDLLADYQRDVVPFLDLLERYGILTERTEGRRGRITCDEATALTALRL